MLTKELIETKKIEGDALFFSRTLAPTNDEQTLSIALENLGRLPHDFNGSLLVQLLQHPNPKIRLLAVKNLGKLNDPSWFDVVSELATSEDTTLTRREAISTIGRMRTEKAIPILSRFLHDGDPKVILQAIRALLHFKKLPEVQVALLPLTDHPNSEIQDAVRKELGAEQKKGTRDKTHPLSPDALKNVLVHADVRETLEHVPDESIHLTFTSPPYYNARDYTIYPSYDDYLVFLEDVFKAVHRITKEGRFFVLGSYAS